MITLVLLLLCVAGHLYSRVLAPLRTRYEPKWTWATVVGGNTIILIGQLTLCHVLGLSLWIWFVLCLLPNVAAGAPVIRWQITLHFGRQIGQWVRWRWLQVCYLVRRAMGSRTP